LTQQGDTRGGGPAEAGRAEAGQAEAGQADLDELARLRAELSRLRDQQPPAGGKHRGRWRTPAAVVAIVVGSILAPVAVVGYWAANEVTNTDRYTQNMAPLITDPAIQRALAVKISAAITSRLDIQGLTTQAAGELSQHDLPRLSGLLQTFSGEIASTVDGAVDSGVARAVASPAMAAVWTQATRSAHAALVKVLSGQGDGTVQATDGKVTISLGPLISQAEHELSEQGLGFVSKLPAANPTFTLFTTPKLAKAQQAYRLVSTLKWALPLLSFGLLALGVLIARRRRRCLTGAALGLCAAMLVLAAALLIARGVYLNSVPTAELPADAAAALFDGLVRFIRDGLQVIFAISLVIAAGAYLTGGSAAAVRGRRGASAGIARLGGGWQARLHATPAGAWLSGNKTPLRIAAVALAAIVFLVWGTLSWVLVAWLVLILLVVLGLIELTGGAGRLSVTAPRPRTEG